MPRLKSIISFLIISFLISGCQTRYIARIGYHQFRIIISQRPVEEVLNDGSLSKDQQDKIRLILEARNFAEREMGLKQSNNYSQYVHLDKDVLAHILTAAPKDRLESKQWWFPIVGHFPYKGFFDLQALEKERAELEQNDFDTFVQPMAAYSTLGWFLDPIFSTYLDMEDHDLADMVIHESVHLTLFVKGNMAFNEQMATFLGRMGAIRFLERFRGEGSKEAQAARNRWADDLLFVRWMKQMVADLEKLYTSNITSAEKIRRREHIFRYYQEEFQQLSHQLLTDDYMWIQRERLNNAVVLAMRTYLNRIELFSHAFEMAGRDLIRLVGVLKEVCREKGKPIENLQRRIEAGPQVSPRL
ncbi:MAG: aminopeptidase [Deltaproteobacteria bacterium]|nr:aminopeptidase [Deltaproteobacteria bacterium]